MEDVVGGGEVVGDGEGAVGGDEVEEMMGDGGPRGGVGFGGTEVHSEVDGHGVQGEDVGVEVGGEGEREVGLARGGGSDEKKKGFGGRA